MAKRDDSAPDSAQTDPESEVVINASSAEATPQDQTLNSDAYDRTSMGFVQVEDDADTYYDQNLNPVRKGRIGEIVFELKQEVNQGNVALDILPFARQINPDWDYNNFGNYSSTIEDAAMVCKISSTHSSSKPMLAHGSLVRRNAPGSFNLSTDPTVESIVKYQGSAHKQASDSDTALNEVAYKPPRGWLYGQMMEFMNCDTSDDNPEVRIEVRKFGSVSEQDEDPDWQTDFPYEDALEFGRLGVDCEYAILIDIKYRNLHLDPRFEARHLEEALEQELHRYNAVALFDRFANISSVNPIQSARNHLTKKANPVSNSTKMPQFEPDVTLNEEIGLIRLASLYQNR